MTRTVCFIPSITETLIDCGVEVIGRTRFCIHPKEKIKSIMVVGGTKDVNWGKLAKLKPDLVILDREENTLAMAESCPYPFFALHITDIKSLSKELYRLAAKLHNQNLHDIAKRWYQVAQSNYLSSPDFQNIPGVIRYLSNRENPTISSSIRYIDYMIWKDPWMAIGPNTFIWSVLYKLGFGDYLIQRQDKYPNVDAETLPRNNCFYLFSSEPFPFEKYDQQLDDMSFLGAVIDGELYSWYGTRSLKFLESQLSIN